MKLSAQTITSGIVAAVVAITAATAVADPLVDAVAYWDIPTANGGGAQTLVNLGSAGGAADLSVSGTGGQGTYVTDGNGNQVINYGGHLNDGVGLYFGPPTAGAVATASAGDGLDFAGDFTLWMRHAQYASGSNWMMSKTTSGNSQGYALQSQSTSYVFYMLRSDSSFDSVTIPVAPGTAGDLRAYDVTMVWDEDGTGPVTGRNGTLTAYVYDAETGLLVDTQSKAMTNMNQTYSQAFFLGNNPFLGGIQDERGDMERAAAWNRTLNANEVLFLTTGVPEPASALLLLLGGLMLLRRRTG